MSNQDQFQSSDGCDIRFVSSFTSDAARNCPVCRSAQRIPLLEVKNTTFHKSHLHMALCTACGSAYFTDHSPVIGYNQKNFEEDYWLNYVQNGAGISAMLEPLLAIDRPRQGNLLDVGCGFGYVPHYWQESGYGKAIGLESAAYGAVGASKLGITILPEYYASATSLHGKKFDYVFSSEVIEHVEDPSAFVNEISGALADDGILVLTTPSASILRQDSPYIELLATLSPDFHFFVASRAGLMELLKKCGFAYVEVRDLGHRLFAWASHRPLPTIRKGFADWPSYLAYLERLSDNGDPHIAGGALYRAVKDSFNLGRFDIADRLYPRFAAVAKDQYGIDFADISLSSDSRRSRQGLDNEHYPSWMGCGIYYAGLMGRRRGVPFSVQATLFRTAIEVMHQEIRIGAQFAGEAAYFLDGARKALAETMQLDHATAAASSDTRPSYVLRHPGGVSGKDVCLLAIYAPDGRVSDVTASYIELLAHSSLSVVVCIAVEDITAPVSVERLRDAAGIIVRQNGGMDFASWAATLRLLPELWDAERMIFTNDSIIALPAIFDAFVARLRNMDTDFVALTESHHPRHHAQSYFFMLRGRSLRNESVRRFWHELPVLDRKEEIIGQFETRLLDLAANQWGLSCSVMFPLRMMFPSASHEEIGKLNVSHAYWEYLTHCGLPFIKVELLRDNPLRLNILHWRSVVGRYGADVAQIEAHIAIPRGVRRPTSSKKSEWQIILSELNHIRLGARRRRKARRSASRDEG